MDRALTYPGRWFRGNQTNVGWGSLGIYKLAKILGGAGVLTPK